MQPTEHWPVEIDKFDDETNAFVYSLAKRFRGVRYFRLHEANSESAKTRQVVKSFLAAGFPIAFGFPVPPSLTAAANVPYRPDLDSIGCGQAAVAVGYKTNHVGRDQHALMVRSSWGSGWGDHGNGWPPIPFLRTQLANNFWTLVSKQFGQIRKNSACCYRRNRHCEFT